jgi:galactose mutarotase-like enzyme
LENKSRKIKIPAIIFNDYLLKIVRNKMSIFVIILKKQVVMEVIIENSGLQATLNSKGAELVSMQSKTTNREYIWDGNPGFWGKHSPVLFPIVGTLKDNFYVYENKKYELSRHGFARDLEFEVIQKTENQATLSLKASEFTKANFPFEFELQISYTLENLELKIGYSIINHGNHKMPYSIGAHPAFALPENFENYTLEFEKQEYLDCFVLENDLIASSYPISLIEKKMPLTYSIFEKDALIFKKIDSKKITILENDLPLLSIKFDDFKNLGIWTKTDAKFICLEPWLGYSDTSTANGNIFDKEGIIILESKQNDSFEFSIEIL